MDPITITMVNPDSREGQAVPVSQKTSAVKDIKGEIRCRNSNKTKGRKDKK